MGQIGQTAVDGYPLWYYGVDKPEDLKAYAIHKDHRGRYVVKKFSSIQSAWEHLDLYGYKDGRVVPCPEQN